VTLNSQHFSPIKGCLIYNYFLSYMAIIAITAGSKTSRKYSNTSAAVEADSLDDYCNSTVIKLSTYR
jgi:hypothetical protein